MAETISPALTQWTNFSLYDAQFSYYNAPFITIFLLTRRVWDRQVASHWSSWSRCI